MNPDELIMSKAEELSEAYPIGTVIRLIHMDDFQAPPDETLGIVTGHDGWGIHVKWESGGSLKLIPEEDEFEVLYIPEKEHENDNEISL